MLQYGHKKERGKKIFPSLWLFYFLSARSALNAHHRRYPGSQLGPGDLTAHESISLVLLHSCPDTVQRVPLRKTKTSTPLTRGSSTEKTP